MALKAAREKTFLQVPKSFKTTQKIGTQLCLDVIDFAKLFRDFDRGAIQLSPIG